MANDILIKIKGDLSNLENGIKSTKELITNTNKDIAKSLQTLENKRKSLYELEKKRNTLSKEEYQKQKKLITSEISETNKLIQAQRARVRFSEQTIKNSQDEYNSKKKLIEVDKLHRDGITKSNKATGNYTNTMVRHLRQIETLVVAYYTLSRGFQATIGAGIEVNKIIESNTMGIAALVSANTRMIDSFGNTLTPMQKFAMGQQVATQTIEELRKASVKTYATFPALLEIYQQAIGQTMSMGDAFGDTVDSISSNTIELATVLSNIAGSIGMPMDRVREEIRSMLSGNASTDSLISTMLFGSPGDANKAIRNAKDNANGVVDLLNDMMADFKVLETTKTYQKGLLTLQDSWSRAMGDMVQESEMFTDITDLYYDMANTIYSENDNIVDSFEKMYKTVKSVVGVLDNILVPATAIGSVYALSSASTALTAGIIAMTVAIRSNPILSGIAIASTIGYGIYEYFEGVNDRIETVNKSLTLTTDKLKEISQRERDTITSALNVQIEDLRLQLSKSITKSRMDRDSQDKKDEVDRIRKELKLLTDKRSVLNEINKEYDTAKEKVDEAKKVTEKQAKLLTNLSIPKDAVERADKIIQRETNLTKINAELVKLYKDRESWKKAELKAGKDLTDEEKEVLKGKLKTEEAIKVKKREIAEEQQKITEQQIQNERKVLNEKLKAVEVEIELQKVIAQLNGEDYSKSSLLEETIKAKEAEIVKIVELGATEIEINKTVIELLNLQLNLKKEINAEQEKAIKEQQKIKDDFEKFEIKIDTSGLNDFGKSLYTINDIFKEMNKEQKLFSKISNATDKEKEKHLENQISGYGNLAGAIGGMMQQGSKEAQAMMTIQSALATVNAVNAVLNQSQGDPYTAFARMAVMAGTVATLLSNIGTTISMGNTSESVSYDYVSGLAENTGTGSVLGDASAQSESIKNSLEILEDFAEPQYGVLQQMEKYLASIDQKMGGVTSLLIQQGGYAFGEGYTGFDTGYKNKISLFTLFGDTSGMSMFSPVNDIINKIPVLGDINQLFGSVINSILGGLFGKTSVSQSMTDSGIYFANQLLTQAIEDFSGSAYQTIKTTVSKKSWFSSSSSTSYRTYFQGLDDETERQFSLVLDNLYNTVLLSGTALDTATADTEKALANFVVSVGKISLRGKTGDEIQEQITAVFGKIGDDIAKTAFPLLTPFQQVGEGMFETLTRVATGMEEAGYYIDRLGIAFEDIKYTDIINQQGDVGFETLAQSIIKVDEAVYGLNNGVVQMIDSMSATASELYDTYLVFENIRDLLVITGQSGVNLNSSMVTGAGGVGALQGGLQSYFENFLTEQEQIAFQTQVMTKEFAKLGIAMPTSVQGYKNLISGIDTSAESGAELYGRLITLADGFADINESVADLNDTFLGLSDSIQKTIDTLLGNVSGTNTQEEKISAYWSKQEKISALLAKGANLSASDTSTLSSLVGETQTLATGIQSSQIGDNTTITGQLVSSLYDLKSALNLENQILNVRIVEFATGSSATNNLTYLPSYDVGTANVPRDMVAKIHKNEIITPAGISNDIRNGNLTLGNNSDIISAINGLNSRMEKIEENTRLTADILDESQNGMRTLKTESRVS